MDNTHKKEHYLYVEFTNPNGKTFFFERKYGSSHQVDRKIQQLEEEEKEGKLKIDIIVTAFYDKKEC